MKKLILLGLMSAFADCSETDAMRKFDKLGSNLHERLPFETRKLPSAATKAFKDEVYESSNRRSMTCSFSDSEKLAIQTEQEEKESPMFLVMQQEVENLSNVQNMLGIEYKKLRYASIHDRVEKLCERCFEGCESLSLVTFGDASSLRLIGKEAFWKTGITEIHIPDRVEELCERCFFECSSLSLVTFGEASSLRLIGKEAFWKTGITEIHIPDSVEELGEGCFYACKSLSRVTFGESSSLKHIGSSAFSCSGIHEIHIPDGVEELLWRCFFACKSLSRVTFGESSSLKRIDRLTFSESGLREIHIPDGVEELLWGCFSACKSLSRVTFGESSSLKRIDRLTFSESGLREIHLPNTVEQIFDDAFVFCRLLPLVVLGDNTVWRLKQPRKRKNTVRKPAFRRRIRDGIYHNDWIDINVWESVTTNGEARWTPLKIQRCTKLTLAFPQPIMQLVGQAHND